MSRQPESPPRRDPQKRRDAQARPGHWRFSAYSCFCSAFVVGSERAFRWWNPFSLEQQEDNSRSFCPAGYGRSSAPSVVPSPETAAGAGRRARRRGWRGVVQGGGAYAVGGGARPQASATMAKERRRAAWSKICAVSISSSAPVSARSFSSPLRTVAAAPTAEQLVASSA